MALIDRPKNVHDKSSDSGFQWVFHCDVCRNGYETTFIKSKTKAKARSWGTISKLASFAGSVADPHHSSYYRRGADAARDIGGRDRSAEWHQEHDAAFAQAVNECKAHYRKCPKCHVWACEVCWNEEAQLCQRCAPRLAVEMAATKSEVRVDQMRQAVKQSRQFDGNLDERTAICTRCNKPVGGGSKFCNNCGAPVEFLECPQCHHRNAPGVKFCSECGGRMG